MKPLPLPRTVDDPPTFLLWRVDDMVPPMVGLALGFMAGHPLLGGGVGLALSLLYRRFREGRPEFYAFHMIYWAGLWPSRSFSFPNPFARSWLP